MRGCSDCRSDMATLTKDSEGRSPFWICCYTAADGRRLKKSTKQKERGKALEVCLALERVEDMARQGTLTEMRTRELLAEVLERTTGETLPFHTAEGFLRHWLAGKLVTVPIHPDLEAHLLDLPAPASGRDSGKAFVFPKLAGKTPSALGHRFAGVMARARVDRAVLAAARGSKGRTVNALYFHSLRHSFNSAMANAGVSQEIRKKLTARAMPCPRRRIWSGCD